MSYEAHFVDNRLLPTTKLTKFARHFLNDMRAEHFAFLREGSTVRAAATYFDKLDEPRFSEWRFGDLWETSFMIGRVRRVLRSTCMVQWDDAEIREVSFEHIELHGDNLRDAETQTKSQKEANMENRGRGPRRTTRNVTNKPLTPEPSEDGDSICDDEPINRLRPETHAESGSPSSPSNSSGTKSITVTYQYRTYRTPYIP